VVVLDFSGKPDKATLATSFGAFVSDIYTPMSKLVLTLSARADHWKNYDGHNLETTVATGLPTNGPTAADSVLGYCGTQCFYDNVIEADPTNSDVVFAAGSFGYGLSPQSGGIYRSVDGGASWKNMGWNQHPDFHALAFDPNNTANVLVGSDGGVWYSTARGGRTSGATAHIHRCSAGTSSTAANGFIVQTTSVTPHSTAISAAVAPSPATSWGLSRASPTSETIQGRRNTSPTITRHPATINRGSPAVCIGTPPMTGLGVASSITPASFATTTARSASRNGIAPESTHRTHRSTQ